MAEDTKTTDTQKTDVAVEEPTQDNNDLDNYGGFDPDDAMVQMAMRHGWRPLDEFDDKKKWSPPDKFIETQFDITDKVKNGNKALERTVEQLSRKLEEMSRNYEDMNKREQGKVEAELKAMRKAAVEEGDIEKVDQIQAQIDDLKTQSAAKQEEYTIPPAIEDWMESNDWYRPGGKGAPDDVQEVIELVEELNSLDEYAKLSPKFRLAKIDKEVADFVNLRRPDLLDKYKFSGIKPTRVNGRAAPKDDGDDEDASNTPRRQISDVEGGAATGRSNSKTLTYENLPPAAKQACDSAVRSGIGITRDEWVKSYNEVKDKD